MKDIHTPGGCRMLSLPELAFLDLSTDPCYVFELLFRCVYCIWAVLLCGVFHVNMAGVATVASGRNDLF